MLKMVRVDRIELSSRDPKSRACPSSYTRIKLYGGQGGFRDRDALSFNQPLYHSELQGQTSLFSFLLR